MSYWLGTTAPQGSHAEPSSEASHWFQATSLGSGPDAWSHYTAPWQSVGDPLADAFLVELRQRGRSLRDPGAELLSIAREARPPAAVTGLLAQLCEVPDWVDFELMRRGAHMAERNFPQLIAALTYGALPLIFVHPSSAAVLLHTGHFAASVGRRVNESATFFLGVTRSDELRPGQRMWNTCLHVPLIAATQIEQDVLDAEAMRAYFMPDDTSRRMVAVLLEGLMTSPPTQRIPRRLQAALMRRALGEQWADALAIPRTGTRSLHFLRRILATYSRLARTRLAAPVARRIGRRALESRARNGLLVIAR